MFISKITFFENEICYIIALLNVFKTVACLTDVGNVFHSLGTETVNGLV